MRHQLGCSVVFLSAVDVVAEVDGHDAAGVVPAHNCVGLKAHI